MDSTEELLAGAVHHDGRWDFAWALAQPHGSAIIRLLGYSFRKVLRCCTARVTFDLTSFERAVAEAPSDSLFVLAPSHRSYFDFLLMSYLCFQYPELGIPIPHIAAADDFARIPIVGRVLKKAQAFYVRRGAGTQAPVLNAELHRLAAQGGSLMFFIEGQRSRSRHVLAPKRGLLRGLQATGHSFVVLPIAFAYERLPEESAFADELRGGARPRMSLRALLCWLNEVARKQVHLGRIHITCGTTARLQSDTDIASLAKHVVAEQQRHTAVSRFHLRAFLAHAHVTSVSEDWLADAIQRRGGRVLDSELPPPCGVRSALQQSLRNQWMHWFFGDALRLFPNNYAIRHHVERRSFVERTAPDDTEDPCLRRVVEELMAPIVLDYELATRHLGAPGGLLPFPSPHALVQAYPVAHLPHLEDAYRALVEHRILCEAGPQSFVWGAAATEVDAFYRQITADFSLRSRRHSSRTNATVQRTATQRPAAVR